MSYNFRENEQFLFETAENYQIQNNEVLLQKKVLNSEESIQYILNKYEIELGKKIDDLSTTETAKLLSFLSSLSSVPINSLPLHVSLIGSTQNEPFKNQLTKDFQLLESKLITNNHQTGDYLINYLKNELLTCDSFDIIVSFIKGSGLNMLINTLEILKEKNIKGRIITSTYMNVTEPAVLRKLNNYPNIELKVYQSDKVEDSFHTKAYIFHRNKNLSSVIVGSSNITKAAFKTGEEWNIRTYEKASDSIYENTTNRFEHLWTQESTIYINEAFIMKYEQFLESKNVIRPYLNSFNFNTRETSQSVIKPNSMQKLALENLVRSIEKGHKRGIAIAATGTGKTFLAAMSAKQLSPKNVLFIAHRNELLVGAQSTFKRIFEEENDEDFAIFKGKFREVKKFTFASIQSLANDFKKLPKDEFELIIIDEFHHATAENYMKIIDHFTPKFLLGLTATPERTDRGDIYGLAEYNIIIDVRLKHALDSELLVPFQYYGISDDTVEIADTKGVKENELTSKLNSNRRVDFIIQKMNQYTLSGPMKCIGFCQNIEHATFMNNEFNKRGINSTVLTGQNTDDDRIETIKKLQNDNDPLDIIFTVDLFNEGTDIPQVNLILFLRPTESAIIFTQQLGRGLRRFSGKEYLVVLDFVTNDRNSYLVPIALSGNETYVSKEKLKSHVENNFNNLSDVVHIELDYKTKDRILKSIDQQNFLSAVYLKKELKQFLDTVRIESKNENRKLNIMDFHSYENAPNLSLLLEGTYKSLAELNKSINELREVDHLICSDALYKKIMRNISSYLPVIMIYDYFSITLGLIKGNLSKQELIEFIENALSITLNDIAKNKLNYAFERTSRLEIDKKKIFHLEENKLKSLIELPQEIIDEISEHLNYGVVSYLKEQNPSILNVEKELVLYKQYTRIQIASLIGYDKDLSTWRDGVKQFKGDHYLFVNLKKDEEILEERLMYEDYFITPQLFHWQSQNKTSRTSKTGQEYINHKRDGQSIHLFVRRSTNEDNRILPFYYLGEVDFISAKGDKPISIEWQLHHPVPKNIMDELEY